MVGAIQDLGIVALGSFGSTAPGLRCLVDNFPDALALVARACLSPAAESKVTAMNSFSQLLGAPTSEEESRRVFNFLESAVCLPVDTAACPFIWCWQLPAHSFALFLCVFPTYTVDFQWTS